MFDILGPERCSYRFRSPTRPVRQLLPEIGNGVDALEWLELYTINRVQQWNLHRPDVIRDYYGRVDEFTARLHKKCTANDITLVLLSDHGHERIRKRVDLAEGLRELDLDKDEFTYFLETSIARFWFHSERAHVRVTELLSGLGEVQLLRSESMDQIHLALSASYGELFAIADSGVMFYPHDFHNTVANVVLGLTDPKQRPRLRDGCQRSNCGYLPGNPSEQGTMIVFNEGSALRNTIDLVDVAPSLLALFGIEPASHMKGECAFDVPAKS